MPFRMAPPDHRSLFDILQPFGYAEIDWDEPGQRFRAVVGVIGEGFEPGVAYVVRDGKLSRRDPITGPEE